MLISTAHVSHLELLVTYVRSPVCIFVDIESDGGPMVDVAARYTGVSESDTGCGGASSRAHQLLSTMDRLDS